MTPNGPSQTLWFLAPGLAHLLGNALFTVQGRLRLVATATPEDLPTDLRAMHDGVDRVQAGLQLLRWLLDEGGSAPAEAGTVLRTLVEVARVPLRDRGIGLSLEVVEGGEPALVDPVALCRIVTAACRAQANTVHGTPHASMQLAWRGSAERGEVRVGCSLLPGEAGPSLAREAALCADALRAELPELAVRWESADQGATLVAVVPLVKATFRAS